MTLKYIWRSFQPRLSFPRPFQLSLACFRVARSPSNSWASCWFRLPNAQNLLPKICTKLPISWLVWHIDQSCLDLLWVLGMAIQWNHAKCCGADPCCHGNDIWARQGDPVAYRLIVQFCLFVGKRHDSSQRWMILRMWWSSLRRNVVRTACHSLYSACRRLVSWAAALLSKNFPRTVSRYVRWQLGIWKGGVAGVHYRFTFSKGFKF